MLMLVNNCDPFEGVRKKNEALEDMIKIKMDNGTSENHHQWNVGLQFMCLIPNDCDIACWFIEFNYPI